MPPGRDSPHRTKDCDASSADEEASASPHIEQLIGRGVPEIEARRTVQKTRDGKFRSGHPLPTTSPATNPSSAAGVHTSTTATATATATATVADSSSCTSSRTTTTAHQLPRENIPATTSTFQLGR